MKLREIVDDLELQRFDALKANAKRASQELQGALAQLRIAKAKQEMLKARWVKYLCHPPEISHDTIRNR